MAHKRSFDVFMAMFPASGQDASRLVDWDTFVLAMSDAGFSARNNGRYKYKIHDSYRSTNALNDFEALLKTPSVLSAVTG